MAGTLSQLVILLLLASPFTGRLLLACVESRFNNNNNNQGTQQNEILLACTCNSSACDSGLRFQWPSDGRDFVRVRSSKAGARFEVSRPTLQLDESSSQAEADFSLRIAINERLHQVTGFGGAFTDSASSLIWSLKEPLRSRLLEDLFGESGLDYNMGRVPIGGTDMSTRGYTYNDLAPGETDYSLAKWSLQPEDLEWKIPLIGRVNDMRARRNLGPLRLIASCWTPPAWMKENGNLIQGQLASEGDSEEELARNPNYEAYARYIMRFLGAYEQKNISLWALSPQNEPRTPRRLGPKRLHHNSVNFTPTQLVAFYKYHMLPQLEAANYTRSRLKVFVWDDVLDDMDQYLRELFEERAIEERVSGVALHWYSQALRGVPFAKLKDAFRELPFKFSMISTEACYLGGQKPGDWAHGSGYARDLVQTLATGLVAWLDWNLALDPSGGPTWAHNPLDSAIQIDLNSSSYLKNPMYYALGHITRFIRANSTIVRSDLVESRPSNGSRTMGQVYAIAAELEPQTRTSALNDREDGTLIGSRGVGRRISLVLLNESQRKQLIRLELPDCAAKREILAQSSLMIELAASSFESFAFVC